MTPEPVTPPAINLRAAQSVYDLEKTLVTFIARTLDSYRLDNPTLNLAQESAPDQAPPNQDPDTVVSYDPTERAQTLYLKQPPRVERGRVPRTVTGEIAVDKLPDVPSVVVQAVSAKVENTETIVTVRVYVCAYDENPDSSGYQDVLNMVEALAIALTTFGQGAIDEAYPIVMPLEWKMIEADTFPHYIAEMTTQWQLPSGRPMPDSDDLSGLVPGERIEFKIHGEPATTLKG